MRRWLLVLGLVGACGNGATPHIAGDGGIDAGPDGAIDGSPDAPVDANPWSITIDSPEFLADPFTHHAVTVTGEPNVEVFVATDRLRAGSLFPADLILDSSGHGTSTYVPCSPAIDGCVGTANLQLIKPDQPMGIVEAATPITLDDPGTGIGDGSACAGSGNVMYTRATAYPSPPTTWQSPPDATWSVLTYPDAARFTINGAEMLELSLQGIAAPLAAGTYTNTQLSPPSDPGRPALSIGGGGGCTEGGRFQIDEITADPTLGTLQSITVRFDASGCRDSDYVIGCLHYETTPVTPPSPPLPDPSKVAVRVFSPNGDGTADTTAMVILTDATGAVVLDTQVDSFGFAQAPLIGTGELTVIEHSGFNENAFTYRGVHAGDFIVLHQAPLSSGAQDQMLATFASPPANASGMYLMTACGGGSWSGGNGLVDADLTFYDSCRTSTFDMLSIVGFSDGSPQQWVWQTGLSHVANGNVEVAGTWAPFDTAHITVTNVPASTSSLAMFLSMKIGAATPEMDRLLINGPPAGDVPFALRYPIGAGDAMVIDLKNEVGFDTPDEITEVLTGASANVTIDYAASPVPLVSAIHQSATGASWTETGGGSVDVRTVMWSATANNQSVYWMITEPYDGQSSSVLPRLPPNHAVDDPATDPAAVLHGTAVSYEDYDVSSGFTLTVPSPPYRARRTFAHTYGF